MAYQPSPDPAAARLCQAHKLFNKVFGIGANKTGTTSLKSAMARMGLALAPQAGGELAARPLSLGQFQPLIDYVKAYDAFQDVPFSVKTTYAQVDVLFPGSRFILTHRDPDEWFDSFLRHHQRHLQVTPAGRLPGSEDFDGKDYLYDGFRRFKFESDWLVSVGPDFVARVDWRLAFDRGHFIDAYRRRNTEIVRYFAQRPADLLAIDLTREQSTERIVRFLGLPDCLASEMPHLNKS